MNQALNSETPSQRADDETLINQCLAYQTCANFETCIANL
jgi:hypothetical protein